MGDASVRRGYLPRFGHADSGRTDVQLLSCDGTRAPAVSYLRLCDLLRAEPGVPASVILAGGVAGTRHDTLVLRPACDESRARCVQLRFDHDCWHFARILFGAACGSR